jgi:hypothetical protein
LLIFFYCLNCSCLHFSLDHTITLLIDLINFDLANKHGTVFGKLTNTFCGVIGTNSSRIITRGTE